MTSYYIWGIIFACIAYLIVTDESVAKAVILISYLIKFQYEKLKWIIIHSPRNPIVRWMMWRRAMKLAKEIQDEIEMERRSRESNDNSTIN
jgi:hypothetical protein